MTDAQNRSLREHLLYLLQGGGAHAKFEDVIAGIPPKLRGQKPAGLPHSLWMLLEHMRIAQRDILEFSRNPKHVSPKWPEGHWPRTVAPPTPAAWSASIKKFRQDLKAMQDLVKNPRTDLFARIPWVTVRPSYAKPCWWPITMRIIWARCWTHADCWERGRRSKRQVRHGFAQMARIYHLR